MKSGLVYSSRHNKTWMVFTKKTGSVYKKNYFKFSSNQGAGRFCVQLKALFLVHRLCFLLSPHMAERVRESLGSLIKARIPCMRTPSPKPNHIPKALPPHHHNRHQVSTQNFGGHKAQTFRPLQSPNFQYLGMCLYFGDKVLKEVIKGK